MYNIGGVSMNKEDNHNCKCEGGHHHHEEDHKCGCQDVRMIYLTLNDGEELACQVVSIFEMEDKEYIALLPQGSEDIYLYGYEETEEGPALSQIEKDEDYERVSKAFLSLCE